MPMPPIPASVVSPSVSPAVELAGGSRPEIATLTPPPLPAAPSVTTPDLERAVVTFLGKHGPQTLATYRQKLRAFADWLRVDFHQLPGALLARGPARATLDVEDFRAHLIATLPPRPGPGRGRPDRPAASTVNGYLAAIRSLVAFLAEAHLCSWTLTIADEPVTPYRDTKGPGADAVRALRRTASRHEDLRLATRDVTILHLLSDLALRRAEVLGLAVGDVQRDPAGVLTGVRILGKGKRDTEVLTLPSRTAAALSAWLAVRLTLDAAPAGPWDGRPLFVSLDPGAGRTGRRDPRTGAASTRPALSRLSPQALARRLAVLGGRARVGAIRPHALRHTAITTLLEQQVPLRDVQKFARHRDPRTTLLYDDAVKNVAGLLAEQLSEIYERDDESTLT